MQSAGRAGSTIADPAKAVFALNAAIREGAGFGQFFWQVAHLRRDVEDYPMNPDETSHGFGVRVIHDQGEAFGALGRITPGKWQRDILSIAGIFSGDHVFRF